MFSKSLVAIAVSSAFTGAMPIQAQENPLLEEIQITGSRVRVTSGMAAPVPVTAVSMDELSSYNPGSSTVEQMAQLPQFFNTLSSQRGSGTLFAQAGGSYLNMRNLGTNRTLILLDGSRLPPADKRGSVNVDMMPTALIRSVDTVTGGASAAYGADALGGVVNFILDRQFEGLKLNVGVGRTEWGDGDRYNLELAGGTSVLNNRLHLVGSFSANEVEQIHRLASDVQNKYDWFKNYGHVTNPAWTPGSSVPQRLTLPCVAPTDRSPAGMLISRVNNNTSVTAPMTSFAYNGMVFTDDGKGVREFVKSPIYAAPGAPGSTSTMGGDCSNPEFIAYQNAHNAIAGNGVVNRSGFGGAQYKFTDRLSGFAHALVGRSESRSTNYLGGMNFTGSWSGTAFRENVYLPPAVAKAMDDANINVFQIWRDEAPATENGLNSGTEDSGVFVTYAGAAGVDYVLPNDWEVHASWQTGESHRRTGIFDLQRVDRTYLALDAVLNPANGQIVCNVQMYNPTPAQLAESVKGQLAAPGGVPGGTSGHPTTEPLASPIGLDGTIENCTPLNIMGIGTNTAAAKTYISTPKIGEGRVNQDFAEVLLQGDIYKGWGYGPLGFAAGLTYRKQSFYEYALPADIDMLGPPQNVPALGIRGIPPGYTSGSANLHARSTVPDVNGSYDVWEWFGEVNVPIWKSTSGQQVIGGSVSTRQSNYSSLADSLDSWKLGLDIQVFDGLRLRLTRSKDIREASFSERFDTQSTGTTIDDPFQGNARYSTTVTSGGNPQLSPEKASTNVVGFVYQPQWLDGLSFSADWYDVKVRDSIAQLGAQRIVNECYSGNQSLCEQLRLDGGQIGRIFDVFLNVAQARVRGIDYELAYNTEPDFLTDVRETLNIRALAGYVAERSDTPFGAPQFDISGWLNNPDLTGIVTATYGVGAYSVQLQQRYIARVGLNRLWVEGRDVDINTVASGNYTNARLGYNGDFGRNGKWGVSLDITNLFDRGPPLVGGATQGMPADYDIYGRRYFLSAKLTF
ncbi:MAG: TonB-dependent receptor [Pseudomonadales bacterium]|nr:TonB-dependent receptor [Pseudomonadales bacterium]